MSSAAKRLPDLPEGLENLAHLHVPSNLDGIVSYDPFKFLNLADCEKLSRSPELAFSQSFKTYMQQHPLFFTEEVFKGFCFSYLCLWENLEDKDFVWLQIQTAKHFKKISQDMANQEFCLFLKHFNDLLSPSHWKGYFEEALNDKISLHQYFQRQLGLGDLRVSQFFRAVCSKILSDYTEQLAQDEQSLVYLRDRPLRHQLISELLVHANHETAIEFLCVCVWLAQTHKITAFEIELDTHLKNHPLPGDPRLESSATFWNKAPKKLLKHLRLRLREDDLSELVKEHFLELDAKDLDCLREHIFSSRNPRVLLPDFEELRKSSGLLGSVYLFRNGHNFSGQLAEASDPQEVVVLFNHKRFVFGFSNKIDKPLLIWDPRSSPSLKSKYWSKALSWTELLKTKPKKISFLPGTLNQVFDLIKTFN